ncbi:uncharacterized protein FIESC28_00813 [Fusarium coffeatum]|uniref:Xylanolytic transcriptional activator regulatory domain-containing protein n=1 Tax=Fusarium coffeatum TaxID=231269 RepID=A0A366SBW4_9HYPO|nr:uncharacterized protein FIESC28_00813 [Fusarium coffeatum]RBR26408.1 hypothetical protein FIESC28_00813 [Fusarium coffeatum]
MSRDTIIKAYFDHVYPFAPILNRTDFVRSYRSGDCSLFLLHAICTAASNSVPIEVIHGCGYADRSAAHTAFFSKAKLFHDFQCQGGSLSMLQGSLILGAIILDHPSDRDFQYWFHNSVRRASRLGVHNVNARPRDEASRKLYRRIWWSLHVSILSRLLVSDADNPKNRDIFHFFVNTQNLRLLVTAPPIEPLTEEDWEVEDAHQLSDLISPTTHSQRASLMVHCELAQIFGSLTSTITSGSSEDLQRLIQPLDSWRTSLPAKMKSDDAGLEGEMYYSEALTTSYRFECIMCRLLRRGRWPVRDETVREWAKERFRAATLELDSILKRVLMGDTIRKMPTTFITTITALLALHIESALDPSESDLVRSMARISIQYTMLALNQIQDTPAIKRALPAFEMVLSKNKLYPASVGDSPQTAIPLDNKIGGTIEVATQPNSTFAEEENEMLPFLSGDLSGFEFFDRWQMEQLDFTGIY